MSPFLSDVHLMNVSSNDDGSRDVIVSDSPGHSSVVVQHSRSNSNDVPFGVVPIVAIFFTFLYLIVKALMAPFTNRNKQTAHAPSSTGLTDEEHAVLEKLQRTLTKMESRVEALETILIEQTRNKEKYGSKL